VLQSILAAERVEPFAFAEQEQLWVFEQLLSHDVGQVGRAKQAVFVICNIATVHNITKNVSQIIPRYFAG
jgi:hypothetical protein